MKFGAVANQSNISWPELLDTWQDLDANSGFDSLWVMDHFVSGLGEEFGSGEPCMEGWTALAALAQATKRVKIGVMVTGMFYRHPSILAKMATTVDHISNGRLIFGIGAGWHEYETKSLLGMPLPSVKERLDRLEEGLEVIKSLWTQPRPSFEGKYYKIDKPPYNPPNLQNPHPPILVGGGGEKRTLKIVAKYADIANVSGSPETIRHKYDLLDGYCKDIGRDPNEITRTAQVPLFLSDNQSFKERVLQGMGARGGDPEETRKSILLGGVDEVKEQIQAFEAAGVEEITVALWPRVVKSAVDRFAAEVIPAFA